MTEIKEVGAGTPSKLSKFGRCVMDLARKRGIRTQAALRRLLHVYGYEIADRTLASYLYGRATVDPALPVVLLKALRLNKKERRELADCFTYSQRPRTTRRLVS